MTVPPHCSLRPRRILRAIGAATVATGTLFGCATPATEPPPPTDERVIGEARHHSGVARGLMNGYLAPEARPDSLKLLPPPPAAGSPAQAGDDAAHQATRGLLRGPRGALATADARLSFPAAAEAFACTAGFDITPQDTPHLLTLMRRTLADAGLATYGAKDHYQRTRPFVVFKEHTCTPEAEERYAKDGSYPSGHSAVGWAWGLLLAELMPERAQALLQRGFSMGQSRVVCGIHWQSDVDAGRVIGAAAVARLQSDPVFQAQMRTSAAEIKAARSADKPVRQDCAAEARALQTPR